LTKLFKRLAQKI